ncbi:Rv3654c family TadE-like protein [Dermatophilaceae bacterium Soc4.6]
MGRRDEGSGSVLVVGGLALLAVVGLCALLLAGVVRATHQARSAADLAALAAAGSLAGAASAGAACARASLVASANGATLRACSADEGSGGVVVDVTLGPASARARAGPAR